VAVRLNDPRRDGRYILVVESLHYLTALFQLPILGLKLADSAGQMAPAMFTLLGQSVLSRINALFRPSLWLTVDCDLFTCGFPARHLMPFSIR
jgi:hypothetical protein